ncbi:MAG TPA: tripartite tricarboxylate transporter TctB family protein [Burkholderiales bacterium]
MHSKASLILGAGFMLLAGAAVIIAMDWPMKAKLFPLAIGIPVFCMATAEVVWGLLDPAARSEAMEFKLSEQAPGRAGAGRTVRAIVWMVGFLAAIVLLGYPFAIPLLVFLYLKLQGREGWVLSGVFALAVWGVFYVVFDQLLHLPFPAGWILQWLGLA